MNKHPTILYIEDEEGIRNQLSKFLKYFSSELFVACDGQEGLELYKQRLPDIVVSDIKMPNMNGIEMVKAIKEINPQQHIVFTTAHSESSYFMDAIDMQVDGYVLKPVNLEKLEEKLENITSQINTKKELFAHQVLTNEITQLQDNILLVLDGNKRVIFSNQKFLKFFNVDSLDSFNSKHKSINNLFEKNSDFFYSKNDENWIEDLQRVEDEKRKVVSVLNKNNESHTFLISLKFIKETSHSIIILTEITNIAIEKKHFERKAYTDELTGIPNRAYFEEEFNKEIARRNRERTPLSFIILDIDKFKDVNDAYGHQVGDEILQDLANTIKSKVRLTDIFARWGGEEFVCILPNTSLDNAKKSAETLRRTVEEHTFKDNLSITCSFGVSEFREDDTKESILKRADDSLYHAKEMGRNRVEG